MSSVCCFCRFNCRRDLYAAPPFTYAIRPECSAVLTPISEFDASLEIASKFRHTLLSVRLVLLGGLPREGYAVKVFKSPAFEIELKQSSRLPYIPLLLTQHVQIQTFHLLPRPRRFTKKLQA